MEFLNDCIYWKVEFSTKAKKYFWNSLQRQKNIFSFIRPDIVILSIKKVKVFTVHRTENEQSIFDILQKIENRYHQN